MFKKCYQGNAKTKGSRDGSISSDKLYSRQNNIKEDKKCHFTINNEDKIVMKIYLMNNSISKYIKLKMLEIKWEIHRNMFWETVTQLPNSSTVLLP
jgi:hypothetical protein